MACGRDADRRAPPPVSVLSHGVPAPSGMSQEKQRMSSRNSRAVVGAVAIATLFGITGARNAIAEDVPSGDGSEAPNGSVFTTEIKNPTTEIKNPVAGIDDQDAYAFQGFPGMALTVSVKPSKGSTLLPVIEVVRPGGELANDDS